MQRFSSTSTRPSGLMNEAPTGQSWTQGVLEQWLHSLGTKKDLVTSAPMTLGSKPSWPPLGESTKTWPWRET